VEELQPAMPEEKPPAYPKTQFSMIVPEVADKLKALPVRAESPWSLALLACSARGWKHSVGGVQPRLLPCAE